VKSSRTRLRALDPRVLDWALALALMAVSIVECIAFGSGGTEGIAAAVVSMPSFELFRAQTQDYQHDVLGHQPRVAIEAGVAQSWHEWLRKSDRFVGMSSFGASAPAPKLFEAFGITAAHVEESARQAIKSASQG